MGWMMSDSGHLVITLKEGEKVRIGEWLVLVFCRFRKSSREISVMLEAPRNISIQRIREEEEIPHDP